MSSPFTMRATAAALAGAGLIAGLALSGCKAAAGSAAGPSGGAASSPAAGTSAGGASPSPTSSPTVNAEHAPGRGVAKLPICASLSTTMTRLQLVHVPSIAQLGGKIPTLPAITINGPGVMTLARAICALPPAPRGEYLCPLDTTGEYLLTFFSSRGLAFPVVSVRLTSCQTVLGSGVTRTAAAAPRFWAVLQQVIGIHNIVHPVVSPIPGD